MAMAVPEMDIPRSFSRRPWYLAPYCLIPAALVFLASVLGCVLAQPTLARPGSAGPSDGMPARLEAHVRMLAETLLPRDHTHPENLDRVADYIRGQFSATGAAVTEQVYTLGGKTYRNVIAHFGPAGGKVLVVGAHYDACGELPGADDNASGVAGLLELSRLLAQGGSLQGIDLVAYTLEEPPYFGTNGMGSAHHASFLKQAGRQVKAMISLEMIGYFSAAPQSQSYPIALLGLFYPSKGNFITVVGNFGNFGLTRKVKKAMASATDLPVRSLNAPRAVPGIDYSDHHPYWDQGFPAVMVTDTAFNRNHAYHTAQDLPERLDYRRMAAVVRGVYQATVALGQTDSPAPEPANR